MSRDGYLPDDVRESDVPGDRPGDEHDPACPQHEDADEVYECGGHNEHLCTLIGREVDGCKTIKPDCECFHIAEQRASDRAEAAYEARREIL